MKKARFFLITLLLSSLMCMAHPAPASANPGRVVKGVAKVGLSVFEIPMSIVEDSTKIIFPLGILTGTVRGTARTVGGILGGTADIALGALPYAKYAVFFI